MKSLLDVTKYRKWLLLIVITIWLLLLAYSENYYVLISEYSYFFFLGICGAIVANSTGAGGGIIFIPFFSELGLAGDEAVGTSILIQCFGMTAGTISWLTASHIAHINSHHLNRLIINLLTICGTSAVLGVLSGQYLIVSPNLAAMENIFKVFSIAFGFILLVIIFTSRQHRHTQFDLFTTDIILLVCTSFIGGLITAWISVGIGEMIAIALILRRYPTMVAISIGVALSSISVLTAAHYHIGIINSVNWFILLFAVPGAILGGTFAYLLSEKLGPVRLKIFFSLWIIFVGVVM